MRGGVVDAGAGGGVRGEGSERKTHGGALRRVMPIVIPKNRESAINHGGMCIVAF
jgi:hypothetical protein